MTIPQTTTGIGQMMTDTNQEFAEKAISERAAKLGIGYANLAQAPINPDALQTISAERAAKAKAIVFFRVGKKLRVAFTDPDLAEKDALLDSLKHDGYALNLNLISEASLAHALSLYAQTTRKKEEITNEEAETEILAVEQEVASLQELPNLLPKMKGDDAVNALHVAAIRTRASDLHLQPEDGHVDVRFRIDGVLQTIFSVPYDVFVTFVRQIKYQARMKLNITTLPQDGQYFFRIGDRKIDVRVSSLPTPRGESMVMRFLDPKRGIQPFSELGFSQTSEERIRQAISLPNGMILVTGPTGSGKTTTLYSMLSEMASPQVKVVTLEDPIEYQLPGITQSQINESEGYTFASGLRSILRQDPDIIMLGEIRDSESAETAAQSALTGHKVLATLHTNSALEAIPRLLNIGIKPFLLSSALTAVVAQRLVRTLCPYCSDNHPFTESEMAAFEKEGISVILDGKEAVGCAECSHTGFIGRTTVSEVFLITPRIRAMIEAGSALSQIEKIAHEEGFVSMRKDALLKVSSGMTTFDEISRVV